jgi:hypothetical protein
VKPRVVSLSMLPVKSSEPFGLRRLPPRKLMVRAPWVMLDGLL